MSRQTTLESPNVSLGSNSRLGLLGSVELERPGDEAEVEGAQPELVLPAQVGHGRVVGGLERPVVRVGAPPHAPHGEGDDHQGQQGGQEGHRLRLVLVQVGGAPGALLSGPGRGRPDEGHRRKEVQGAPDAEGGGVQEALAEELEGVGRVGALGHPVQDRREEGGHGYHGMQRCRGRKGPTKVQTTPGRARTASKPQAKKNYIFK